MASTGQAAGRPINVVTGKLWHTNADLALPGPFGLRFSRWYDNQAGNSGDLGIGWRHNYSAFLDLTQQGSNRMIVLHDEEDRRASFTGLGAGGSVHDDISGLDLALNSGGTTYTLTAWAGAKSTFDSAGRLTSVSDRVGNTQTIARDSAHSFRISTITDAPVRTLTFGYDASNRITSVATNIPGLPGNALSMTYDTGTNCPAGNLCSVTEPDGNAWTYQYDGSHNLTTVLDPLGHAEEINTYSGTKCSSQSTEGGQNTLSFDYGSGTTTVTDGLARSTTYTYDPKLLLVTNVSGGPGCGCGGGQSRTFTWDNFLRKRSETDGDGATNTITWSYGRDLVTKYPYGFVDTVHSYPSPTSKTEPLSSGNNRTTQWTYYGLTDVRRDLIQTESVPSVDPLCSLKVTTDTFDVQGLLRSQAVQGCIGGLSKTYTTAYTYDSQGKGRVITVDGPRTDVNDTTTNAYYLDTDSDLARRGQLKTSTDAVGNVTTYAGASAPYNTYDPFGHPRSVTDPNGVVRQMTYDARGRLVTSTIKGVTGDPADLTTTYAYDAAGRLNQVTLPLGNGTASVYDGSNRLTEDFRRMRQQTSPVSGQTSFTYDEAGNLKTSTDANSATTTRTYDAANRVTSAASSRSGLTTETVTWAYDDPTPGNYGKGRLSSMSDPTNASSPSALYTYERRGLLASEARTVQGYSYSLGYGYDGNGNRSSITYPSGRVVSYLFDFADRPNFVSGVLSGYPVALYLTSATYKPFGPVSQLQLKAVQTITYDSRYRPLENQVAYFYMGGHTTFADYTYTEDAVGNITQIHDALVLAGGYDRNFAYDDLNRLTTANSGSSLWGTATGNGYTYDRMGNMLLATLGSSYTASFSYVGTTPKLSSVTDNGTLVPVTYDSAGNTTAESSATYTYTPRSLLSAGDDYSYVYDGRGLRTVLNGAGPPAGKKYYFYSPEMNLLAETEFNTSGAKPAILYEYIWLNGRPIAQVDWPNTTHWTHTDHLGTPFLQTDSSANLYWQVEYEPYGRVFSLRTVSDQHQPLRFPGQEVEQITTGTNGITPRTYNIFRWYRRRWGRYTQPDPIGLGLLNPSTNLFAYVDDRPTAATDPEGLLIQLYCTSVGQGSDQPGRRFANRYGAQHCFVRVKCDCPPSGPYDLKLEATDRNNDTGTAVIPPNPPRFGYGQGSIVPISPSKNDSKECSREDCIRGRYNYWARNGYPYPVFGFAIGPNSNTFANDLLTNCGFTPQWPPKTPPFRY